MTKELEALDDLFDLVTCQESFEKGQKCYDIIEEALQRLEAINKTNPSEALECLDKIEQELECCINGGWVLTKDDEIKINTIKDYILKAQEQEKEIDRLDDQCLDFLADIIKLKKILRIIFEKQVDFEVFGAFDTYKDYEIYYNKKFHVIEHKLTEEEFNAIKRYFNRKESE